MPECMHQHDCTFFTFEPVEESAFRKAFRSTLQVAQRDKDMPWDEIDERYTFNIVEVAAMWNTRGRLDKGVVDRGGTDVGMASRIADLDEPE